MRAQLDLLDPPAVSHSATSVAAAELMKPHVGRLQALVLEYVRSRGDAGSTDEEIQLALTMAQNTERPRRRELERAGLIVDSGRTRKVMSGRLATVWVAA